MEKCNTQANDMATTANNWQTPGASNLGRYSSPRDRRRVFDATRVFVECYSIVLSAFDSRHSRRSSLFSSALDSLLLLLSSYVTSSLFPFRLGPKISGRDLLLVEECCNTPDSLR